MPLTRLDDNCALIVIDLQKGVVSVPTAHPIRDVIERASLLARGFREHNFPVVLVNVSGKAPGRTDGGSPKVSFPPDWTNLVQELGQRPADYTVTKQRLGAFIGTPLQDFLRQHRVTQVFIAGVATSSGVESTARSAYDYGYNVVLVTDAMTDRDIDAHRHSVEKVFPRIAETARTDDVLKILNEN